MNGLHIFGMHLVQVLLPVSDGGVPAVAQWVKTPSAVAQVTAGVRVPILAGACSAREGSGVAMSCGVGSRCGLDPELLWLWCRPAAVAPI